MRKILKGMYCAVDERTYVQEPSSSAVVTSLENACRPRDLYSQQILIPRF